VKHIYPLLLALATPACLSEFPTEEPNCDSETCDERGPKEQPVFDLPLTGKAAESRREFSGLTWADDWLVMLPQRIRRNKPL